MGRAPALLALAAALIAWYEIVPHLGALSVWPGVLILSFVLMPALFAVAWFALPLRDNRYLIVFALAAIVAAVILSLLDAQISANFAKFAAVTAVGWLFLTIFEALSWVVTVSLIIPFIDAFSVWRGPTKAITTHHPAVFSNLSVGFVLPGGSAARLGLPDVMFFAVFLGASVRFGLRPRATWIGMTLSLAATMILTTFWSTNGLPALPGISLGFLVPNADLIWRRLVGSAQTPAEASGG